MSLAIRALLEIGSVTEAKAVGKTRRSAYKLRDRPGAESFAAAWDEAMERGFQNLHDHVIDRALHGAVVPRYHGGRPVGVAHRYYDRVAIAVLGGRGVDLATRIRRIEAEAERRAYGDVERGWRETHANLKYERGRRILAEDKLKRLAAAGLVGADWPDPDVPHPPLPGTGRAEQPAPAEAAAQAEPAGPRVRLL